MVSREGTTMRRAHTLLFALVVLWPASLAAQVPELTLPDMATPETRQRAVTQAHTSLTQAIANARAGRVILTRGADGQGFVPIDRSAFETSIAVQIKSGQLTEAQGQALRQQTLANQSSIIAEAEAYATKVGAALPATTASRATAGTSGAGAQGQVPCEFLRQAASENIEQSGVACQLRLGNPQKPDQAFVLGTADGPASCESVRNEFRASFGSGSASSVREVPGLGEFGFEGPSRDMYGIAFCRNGYAFFGMADASAPASVHAAIMARARLVDARLRGVAAPAAAPSQAVTCNPPAVGALSDGSAAALILRSGACVSGVLLDMGGADYTIRTREGERRVPLDQVAVIDFTIGGPSDGSPPAGQHLLVTRNGQRSTGRLFDLRDRSPLTVHFDDASGRRSWSTNDVDRVILWPVPTAAGANPGAGAPGAGTSGGTPGAPPPSTAIPRAMCTALSGDWRRADGMVIRVTQGASAQQGFILDPGSLGSVFRVGEQTFSVDRSPQPGICTGQVLFRYGDGRSEWRTTRVTLQGSDVFDTDNAGRWTRVGTSGAAPGTPGGTLGGAPGGTPGATTGRGGSVLGTWRGCDGRMNQFVQSGDEIIGRYTALGGLPPTVFAVGDVSHRLRATGPGRYEGFVEYRYFDGRRQWMPTSVTIDGDSYRDTGSDSCAVAMTRVGGATSFNTPAMPPVSAPQAPPQQPPSAQPAANFSGDWDTVNGGIRTVMRLQQQGNRVTGTYDYQQGLLLGVVTGNTLVLTWTHGTPSSYMGSGQFVLSADGRSFSGTWVSPDWGQQGTWSGTRR
jgi:hypothetical protein